MRHNRTHPTCRNHQIEDNAFEQKNIAHQTDARKSPVDGLLSTYHSRGFERGGFGQH